MLCMYVYVCMQYMYVRYGMYVMLVYGCMICQVCMRVLDVVLCCCVYAKQVCYVGMLYMYAMYVCNDMYACFVRLYGGMLG